MERFPRMKRTIINIRGTNGSGKTKTVYRMLELFGNTPLLNDKGETYAYRVHFEPQFYVLGRYEQLDDGCDMIKTIPKIAEGVRSLAEKGNVLFEGILVSLLAKPWIELAHSMPNAHFIFGTLDTPAARCAKQLIKRRLEEGYKDPSAKNAMNKYKAVWRTHQVLKDAGMDVRTLYHKRTTQELVNWFVAGEFGDGT